jgi:hypothetical protein
MSARRSPNEPTAVRLLHAVASVERLMASGGSPRWACCWAAQHHQVDALTLALLVLEKLAARSRARAELGAMNAYDETERGKS